MALLDPQRAERLIPMIAEGGMVFHYSPYDTQWLNGDPWIAPARDARMASASSE